MAIARAPSIPSRSVITSEESILFVTPLLFAIRAGSVNFVLVIFHFETVTSHNFHLQIFQLGAIELDDFPAMQTDQMIVVRNVDVVFCISIRELTFYGNSSLYEQFQRSKDRGRIDIFPLLP